LKLTAVKPNGAKTPTLVIMLKITMMILRRISMCWIG